MNWVLVVMIYSGSMAGGASVYMMDGFTADTCKRASEQIAATEIRPRTVVAVCVQKSENFLRP